jgi:hypothetical protein
MTEDTKEKYIQIMKPLFFPDDPVSNDIVNYFSSLLRICGMEDKGWDPYLESRNMLNDLNGILQTDLPEDKFPDAGLTKWRIALIFYSHIVEMDAPYEVLMNLLRFKLQKNYSPNPFFEFLNDKQKKNFRGLYPKQKIELIEQLTNQAGLEVRVIFDDFYNGKLRNAISHSDYILTEDEFRCRSGTGAMNAFSISLENLNQTINKAQAFLSAFFELEFAARKFWGRYKNKAIPYDAHYKGLMEVLVDKDDNLCGFKVHWPNNSESYYKRTENGCDMTNCMLGKNLKVELFVSLYARNPGHFSPLVEHDQEPAYTKMASGETPSWPI